MIPTDTADNGCNVRMRGTYHGALPCLNRLTGGKSGNLGIMTRSWIDSLQRTVRAWAVCITGTLSGGSAGAGPLARSPDAVADANPDVATLEVRTAALDTSRDNARIPVREAKLPSSKTRREHRMRRASSRLSMRERGVIAMVRRRICQSNGPRT